MAYPAYADNYNSQVGFPSFNRTMSYHPSEYAYGDSVVASPLAYSEPPHPVYSGGRQMSHYASAYDDGDGYYPDRPVTPYGQAPRLSGRAMSTMSHRSRPLPDSYRRSGYSNGNLIKFKRKGGFRGGVSLGEAMANVRLSGNDAYSFHDLAVDHRGRIILKVRWSGYNSMTYEIPVDGYDGRVQLQTLARRIARAIVHFLQANMIPVSWDRVILYHLEEYSPGVWQPVLSTT